VKYANNITINVFVKPEEDEETIRKTFLELINLDLEKEKLLLKRKKAKGFNQRAIIIYEVRLEKEKHTNYFLREFVSKLNEEQKELLVRQKNRLDDDLHFFIRLDKNKLNNNEYYITDSGECYHINIGIASFPRKKEVAEEVIREIFK
jgi:RNA binding exosome subunit